MSEVIHEIPSIIAIFNGQTKKFLPWRIKWRGRIYTITTVGLHYSLYEGRVLYHFFTVADDNLFFRLKFNTENLQWILEEIDDLNRSS